MLLIFQKLLIFIECLWNLNQDFSKLINLLNGLLWNFIRFYCIFNDSNWFVIIIVIFVVNFRNRLRVRLRRRSWTKCRRRRRLRRSIEPISLPRDIRLWLTLTEWRPTVKSILAFTLAPASRSCSPSCSAILATVSFCSSLPCIWSSRRRSWPKLRMAQWSIQLMVSLYSQQADYQRNKDFFFNNFILHFCDFQQLS